jgi:hypothetical protein
MSYYAAPFYVGLSCLLSLSFSSIESIKKKGLDFTSGSIEVLWVIISAIVAAVVATISGEMTIGLASSTHIIIMILLIVVTLCISSSLVYWSAMSQ